MKANFVANRFRKVAKGEFSVIQMSLYVTKVKLFLLSLFKSSNLKYFIYEISEWVAVFSKLELDLINNTEREWQVSIWGHMTFDQKNSIWSLIFLQLASFETIKGEEAIRNVFKEAFKSQESKLFKNLQKINKYSKKLSELEINKSAIDYFINYFKKTKED